VTERSATTDCDQLRCVLKSENNNRTTNKQEQSELIDRLLFSRVSPCGVLPEKIVKETMRSLLVSNKERMMSSEWPKRKISKTIRRFSQWLRREMKEQGRDQSHGMEHFERVREGALCLAAAEAKELSPQESLLLQLAALCHDVLDHKYFYGENSQQDMLRVENDMKRSLRDLAGLSPSQVMDVCLISDNISLSKEIEGRMEKEKLKGRNLCELRDLVSDADKLDALGICGLKRLAQHQVHLAFAKGGDLDLCPGHELSKLGSVDFHEEEGTGFPLDIGDAMYPSVCFNPTSASSSRRNNNCEKHDFLSVDFLRDSARRFILHRVEYLKTDTARREGQRLLRETECIMASDAAMKIIIEGVLNEEA